MKEFLQNIFVGFIGGLLVYLYQLYKEKKKEHRVLNDRINNSRILPKNIIYKISPGMTMRKIDFFLGVADYSFKINEKDLYGSEEDIIIHDYIFDNCRLRVFEIEKSVSGFLIEPLESGFDLIKPDSNSENQKIYEFAIDDSFSKPQQIITERSARESWFGTIYYFGQLGNYQYFCYYGTLNWEIEPESVTIDQLMGELITSFGISTRPENFRHFSF